MGATIQCPSCGTELPAGFKFCGGCGKPIDSAPAPETPQQANVPRTPARTPIVQTSGETQAQSGARIGADERRTVTILFADISGFTAMSEKLDPEVVQEIMDRAFERLTAVINGYGGTIDKYIGDAVMALFGAPVALGDDPERAVRAGLGMQQVMSEYAEELKRTRGFGLAMRVGVNTGKVIWGRVGGAGEKSFTVMGDAVNLASRLEHAAPLGGVLIGEATQRHVRTRFSLEALDPIQVKGKAELQRVYRVLGEVAGPARATVMGPRSPFVGRDEEMAELTATLVAIGKGASGVVATLEASPGSGKSRMVLELRNEAEEHGVQALAARSAPFGHGSPFAPWGDMLDRAAGLAGAAPGTARQKIRAWLAETAPDADADPRWFDELTNVADTADPEIQRRRENPAQFRQNLREAVVTWLWAYSKHRALVFFAEDLHWWPAPSLELLANAAQVARKAPLLLIATRRPDPVAIEWPPEKTDRVIKLGAIDEGALQALAHGILGGEVPKGLVQRLLTSSGGNPFFAEELVQAFIDTGALRTSPDRGGWIWDEAKAEHANLPTTVEGVTQARIDALPPRERHVLQMAAVAGRTFWQGLIEAMGESEASDALRQLSARDLVHGHRSRLAGEVEYAFKHATIQTVAYENHLKRERVVDHRRVAEWLEARAGADPEFAPTIAEHFLRAEEKAKALPFLLRSAEEQVRAFATLDQATDVQLAVSVAEEAGGDAQLGKALRMRGFLRRVKNQPDAEQDLRKAIDLGETLKDSLAVAEAAKDLAGYFMRSGNAAEWERFASKCLDAAQQAGSSRLQVSALNMLAVHADSKGDRARARDLYREALAVAERSGDGGLVGFLELSFGYFHLSVGEYQEAVEAFERASKATLSRENTAILRSNLGLGYLELGRNEEARRELDAAMALAQAIDLKPIEAEVTVRLGALDFRAGRTSEGRARLSEGIALARSVRAIEQLVEGLLRKGVGLLAHDVAEAKAALEEARNLASESGYYLAEVERALATTVKG